MSSREYELRFTNQSNNGNVNYPSWRFYDTIGLHGRGGGGTLVAQYTFSGSTVTDLANRTWDCGTHLHNTTFADGAMGPIADGLLSITEPLRANIP